LAQVLLTQPEIRSRPRQEMVNCNAAFLFAAILLQLFHSTIADHPCTAEVASACAESPGSDMGACLKDPEEHDNPTEISSGCTDFIALNKACADDIEAHCDAGQFTDDTILCLTKWAPQDAVSAKCKGVLSWAVPGAEEGEDGEVVTDELGMSDEDYKEKKEWQAKRKAARGDSIERLKQKDVDKKKEEDRVSLEEFAKNDPEGHAQMLQQQAEEAKQQAAFKKRERAQQAAIERAKKKAAGESEEDEDQSKSRSNNASGKKKSKGSWLNSIMSLVVLVLVGAGCWFLYTQMSNKKGGGGRKATGKKKR